MIRITAIVYNIEFSFGWLAGWRAFAPAGDELDGLVRGHRHGDGHVVDHAGHAVDVGGELGDEAFFRVVLGDAGHGDDAVRRGNRRVQGAGRTMRQQRRLDLRRDGGVINLVADGASGAAGVLAIVIWLLTDLTLSMSLAYSVVSSFCAMAAGFTLQGDDAVLHIYRGAGGAHVAMEQQRGFHFHADPGVGMFRRLFAGDGQLVVHAVDAGQARHGVFGQGFVRLIGDRAGQRDDAVLGFNLDGIILEVGFEHIGLRGGRLDAAVRVRSARSGELVMNRVLTTAASVRGYMVFIFFICFGVCCLF